MGNVIKYNNCEVEFSTFRIDFFNKDDCSEVKIFKSGILFKEFTLKKQIAMLTLVNIKHKIFSIEYINNTSTLCFIGNTQISFKDISTRADMLLYDAFDNKCYKTVDSLTVINDYFMPKLVEYKPELTHFDRIYNSDIAYVLRTNTYVLFHGACHGYFLYIIKDGENEYITLRKDGCERRVNLDRKLSGKMINFHVTKTELLLIVGNELFVYLLKNLVMTLILKDVVGCVIDEYGGINFYTPPIMNSLCIPLTYECSKLITDVVYESHLIKDLAAIVVQYLFGEFFTYNGHIIPDL